jgi:hypothetical protein
VTCDVFGGTAAALSQHKTSTAAQFLNSAAQQAAEHARMHEKPHFLHSDERKKSYVNVNRCCY